MEKQNSVELGNLYGSAWFYASYYLLLKSESREDDKKTNYFYKGGEEAAELYNMIGWDFDNEDARQKAKYARIRARAIKSGNKEAYKEAESSEELYEQEKILATKASRLGRLLGMDLYREKIKDFVLSEEQTPWLEAHQEYVAQRDALIKVLSSRLGVVEKDVIPLMSVSEKYKGEYFMVALEADLDVEPVRFLGIEDTDDGKVYLLEHIREIGTGWSGNNTLFKNIKDNAMNDGCLEIIEVNEEEAAELFVGLNSKGSFSRGRLEARCILSDTLRHIKSNLLNQRMSRIIGKPRTKYRSVVSRYNVRKERQNYAFKKGYVAQSEVFYKDILENQQAKASEIRKLGDNGIERLDAIINAQIRRQREEVLARYRLFAKRPGMLSDSLRQRAKQERPPLRLRQERMMEPKEVRREKNL